MIYEYYCEDGCKLSFSENRPSKNRDDETVCPRCKKLMSRILGCPSFIFKGAGFYCNDYKNPTKEK